MTLLAVLVLAILQGLTEFLPISSSAHLILVPTLLGWPDQGLAFDVAVHVGTLAAVLTYFRSEVAAMARGWLASLAGRHSRDSRLAWAVLWGTVPVGLAGLALADAAETWLRSPMVIAATTIGFGVALGWSDIAGPRERDEHSLRWRDVAVIGLAQALALIPGTSRSGITITAGLMLGLTRTGASRFSFLLAIPVIVLAGGHQAAGLWADPGALAWQPIVAGVALSAITAYLAIHFFLELIERIGTWPFVAYRLVLGGVLLAVFL